MSVSSKIEWTDATWNPVTGCDHVSAGCDNCYAEALAHRFGRPFIGEVECHADRLDLPLHWRKPRRVFVNSVSDLFHPDVPEGFIRDVWATMAAATQHTFQILTKRPQRMAQIVGRMEWEPLPNVWLGISVENQRYADLRIPHLLATPATVRFLSVEPLLGPVVLRGAFLRGNHASVATEPPVRSFDRVDWVIVGGESGSGARPMHPSWARTIRDQCVAARVPFFFKQWGAWVPGGDGVTSGRWVDPITGQTHATTVGGRTLMTRVAKRVAGRKLDGRTWDEFPAISSVVGLSS